jgi:DNA modification methylase
MPPDLVEPCILAGSKPGELVLDPFAGAGTVLLVAAQHERRSLGVEINPDYANITNERIAAWEDKDATRQAIFSELGA